MQPNMCLQVAFLIEPLTAVFHRTYVLFHAEVGFYVDIKSLLSAVGFQAPGESAIESFDFLMDIHVILQVAFSHEGLFTARLGARKRSNGVLKIC